MSEQGVAWADVLRALFVRIKGPFHAGRSQDGPVWFSYWDGKHWVILNAPDGAQLADKVKEAMR